MNHADLLADLQAKGVKLTVKGDKLALDYRAGTLPPALKATLKAHKAALIAILATGPAPRTHADEEWERFMSACKPWPDGRGWHDPREMKRFNAHGGQAREPEPPEETAVERADRERKAWEQDGHPPGVRPAHNDSIRPNAT